MAEKKDIKALLKMLGEKKPRGRPKGVPKHPLTGSKKRTPGPGRPKKLLNKKTDLVKELKELQKLTLDDVLSEEKYIEIIEKTWKEATAKNSSTCTRLWLDMYNNNLLYDLRLKVKTFEEIEQAAQVVMDDVCSGKLLISQGKELMYMLHFCKGFKEGTMTEGAEKIIEDNKNKNNKMK